MELESMSAVLASVSSLKEKAAKAMASLHSHRNLMTSCITEWEELERSFGVTERALQQKFKELAEREKEFDKKMKDAQVVLDKREVSIAGREEASLTRVREQKDSAVAAIVEERKKLQEECMKVRADNKETIVQGKTDKKEGFQGKRASVMQIEKLPKDASTTMDQSTRKEEEEKDHVAKDGQRKKEIASKENDSVQQDASAHPLKKTDEQKKDAEEKKALKKGGEESSKNKRKDNKPADEAAAKRQKEASSSEAKATDLKNMGSSNGASSLEEAVNQVKLLSGVPISEQIKAHIEKIDGVGLREFLVHDGRDYRQLRPDLQAALQASSDPCRVVLKVLEGSEGTDRVSANNKSAHVCIFLLGCLAEVVADPVLGVQYPVVPSDAKELAKTIARRWKSKLGCHGKDDYTVNSQLFLQLLATFGIWKEYSVDDLLTYVVAISRRGVGPALCRALGLIEWVPVLVDRLVKEGKQIEAIAFASSFGLLGKFNPEIMLKSYLEDSQKAFELDKVPSRIGAYVKHIKALKNAVEVIEEYKLDTEFPLEDLRTRIAVLTHEKTEHKKAHRTGKQGKKSEKSSHEFQSGRHDVATNSGDKLDVRSGHGVFPMGYASALDRGHYTPTDLGRTRISDYVPSDSGQSFHSSYDSELRFKYERGPESVFAKYGMENSYAFPSRDGFLRGSASHLPTVNSYNGRSRDEIEAFSSSHGRPTEYRSLSSGNRSGGGLPPPSSYLPYYLR